MKDVYELTKVLLKNAFRRSYQSKNLFDFLLEFIVIVIIYGSISIGVAFSSYKLTKDLIMMNQAPVFISVCLLLAIIFLIFRNVFETLNILYFSNDLKVLVRMPISPIKIIMAKFNVMIISEYLMELMLLLSPILVYGYLINAGIIFYIYSLIILLLFPIVPIVVTSLITILIMRFTSIMKNRNSVQYVTIALTTMFLWVIMNIFVPKDGITLPLLMEKILETNGIVHVISEYFITLKSTMNAIINYDNIEGLKSIIIFALQSLLSYIIVSYIASKVYLKGVIGLSNVKQKDEKVAVKKSKEIAHKYFKKNITGSYLIKEFKTLYRNPTFLIQCILMPLIFPITFILPLALIILKMVPNEMALVMPVLEKFSQPIGFVIALSAVEIFFMMNTIALTAISRDGKNSIFMKYIPVSLYTQFKYKIFPSILVNISPIIMMNIAIKMIIPTVSYSMLFIFSFILMLMNIFENHLMLLVDLNKPRTIWDNEYTMMKQNTNVVFELFYALIVIGILIVLGFIFKNIYVLICILSCILLILNVAIDRYVKKNQLKVFSKIF